MARRKTRRLVRSLWAGTCLLGAILAASPSRAAEAEPAESVGEMSLEEISRRLENPLSSLWSLTFQENLSLIDGDLLDDTETSNTFFFQPGLPMPLGRDKLFILRPVFPVVTSFALDGEGGVAQRETGLGDIQVLSVVGPNRADGIVWGVGATLKFPTASDDILGQGKYQAGPTAMFFKLEKPWTLGVLVQHWWSYAGDSDRPRTNQTDIQYVARRQIPGAWSIGMGPTISVNWEASEGNRLTLPIGLGITKTVRLGKIPIKMRFEPQYSLIRPNDIGTAWNFRIQVSPVIPSPFSI